MLDYHKKQFVPYDILSINGLLFLICIEKIVKVCKNFRVFLLRQIEYGIIKKSIFKVM